MKPVNPLDLHDLGFLLLQNLVDLGNEPISHLLDLGLGPLRFVFGKVVVLQAFSIAVFASRRALRTATRASSA